MDLSLGMVSKVLQGLLIEHIPLTDIRTIVETLAENAPKSKDTEFLISQVRIALSRLITQKISGLNEELPIITLKPELEQLLQNTIQNSGAGGVSFEPGMADKIQQSLAQFACTAASKTRKLSFSCATGDHDRCWHDLCVIYQMTSMFCRIRKFLITNK